MEIRRRVITIIFYLFSFNHFIHDCISALIQINGLISLTLSVLHHFLCKPIDIELTRSFHANLALPMPFIGEHVDFDEVYKREALDVLTVVTARRVHQWLEVDGTGGFEEQGGLHFEITVRG